MWRSFFFMMAIMVLAGCAGLRSDPSCASRPLPIVQTLSGFHKPESTAISLDGKTLFVSNCGSGFFGEKALFALAAGKGAISKLSIGASGELTLVEPRFVENITAPLGLSVLPLATRAIPAGTLFVNTGYFQQTDAQHAYILDYARLAPAVLLIDPANGRIIGRIALDAQSPVGRVKGAPFLVPNGLAFDGDGNLYIAESGALDDRVSPPVEAKSGVLRIPHGALDSLVAGRAAPGVTFLPIEGGPNGVLFDAETDALYVVTCGADDPWNGAVFKLRRSVFDSGVLPRPLARDLTAADGIVRTADGRLIVSLFDGRLVSVASCGAVRTLTLDPPTLFAQPSDLKILNTSCGRELLLMPEQAPRETQPWQQRLFVIRL